MTATDALALQTRADKILKTLEHEDQFDFFEFDQGATLIRDLLQALDAAPTQEQVNDLNTALCEEIEGYSDLADALQMEPSLDRDGKDNDEQHQARVARIKLLVAQAACAPQPVAPSDPSRTPECVECHCRTGGARHCYLHAPFTVYPKGDGSFIVDRNGRARVSLVAPPSLEAEVAGLERITPSALSPEEQWNRNGEYVRLCDVMALLQRCDHE